MGRGYNHYDVCTCGWCVHCVRRERAEAVQWMRANKYSFTVPNARCPECTIPVFYYESEHGGRVYFDRLGVPWPKHSCTDKGNPPTRFKDWRWEESRLREAAAEWQKEGVKPLACLQIKAKLPDGWMTALIKDVETAMLFQFDVQTSEEASLIGHPLLGTERSGSIVSISSPAGIFLCRPPTIPKIESDADRAKRWAERLQVRQRTQKPS